MPKPMPSSPPPANPEVIGDSGRPLGANLERLPSQSSSRFCAPTRKLLPAQTLPLLSIISLPGALSPPPLNLSGSTQALGAQERYGMNGVGRSFLPFGTG